MAFKDYSCPRPTRWVTIGGSDKAGKPNPTSLKGRYLGKTVGPNKFDTTKTSTTVILDTPQGITGINANTDMARKFSESESQFVKEENRAAIGALCSVEFMGTRDTQKGNPMKVFKVLFDPEDVVETEGLPVAENTTYADDEDNEDNETYDSGDGDEDAAQAEALAAAEQRKAKLAALMAKTKKQTAKV